MNKKHSLSFWASEDLDHGGENVDGCDIDSDTVVNRVVMSLCLGVIHHFTSVVHHEQREKSKSTVETDAIKGSWLRVQHLQKWDSHESTHSKGQRTSPVEELLRWWVVCYCCKRASNGWWGDKGIVDNWHGVHVDQWQEGSRHCSNKSTVHHILENELPIVVEHLSSYHCSNWQTKK